MKPDAGQTQPDTLVVICRADRPTPRRKGHYVLATRQTFASHAAAKAYADTINASRQPIIVTGRWAELRAPETQPSARPQETTPKATCDMVEGCAAPITHIDHKGYIYCQTHGAQRQQCRPLTPHERDRIARGLTIERF